MTRKDYIAIASVFAYAVGEYGHNAGAHSALLDMAERISDVMAADNPRFDRGVFLQACRVLS